MKALFAFRVAAAVFCGALLFGAPIAEASGKKHKSPGESWQPGEQGQRKITICHIPPGNPANAHNITVGQRAALRHIRIHGDSISCPTCACPPVKICDKCKDGDCPSWCKGGSSSSSSAPSCEFENCSSSSSSSCESSSSSSSCGAETACGIKACLADCYTSCDLDCGAVQQ